jgi:hypothetical protein
MGDLLVFLEELAIVGAEKLLDLSLEIRRKGV